MNTDVEDVYYTGVSELILSAIERGASIDIYNPFAAGNIKVEP